MKSLGAFARLTRIEHALLLDIAVLVAIALCSKAAFAPFPSPYMLLLALAVPALVQMASFALNDYFDVETDRANKKKDRPIVSGEASEQEALALAIACYLLGNAAAYMLGMGAFAITAVFSALSVLYNWKLKDVALAGNAYIAATMAIPFVFGSVVASGKILGAAWVFAIIAFIIGLGREIMKTAQDFEGDKKTRGAKTLPAYAGEEGSLKIAAALYVFFVPLSCLPFFFGIGANLLSMGLAAVADFAVIAVAAQLFFGHGREKKEGKAQLLKRCRDVSLMALFVGLCGYLAGAF